MNPLAVGIVGAGPWARKAYAPMLAAGPETRLAGIWSRRLESAREAAAPHGADAVESFDELLDRSEAIAFAVPPDAQAELAARAARAGKHLFLDKPLALTLAAARDLVDAVDRAGVVTQLMLTHRFRPRTIEFLERARTFPAIGGRLAFLTGAFLDGPYANAWRREHGALHDLGPHALDLLHAALGPIHRLDARGDPRRWVAMTCEHESGAISSLVTSGVVRLPQSIVRVELFGPDGALELDAVAGARDEPWSLARRTFVDAVRAGRSPALDAHHGLVLQELIDRAQRSLG